jgi:hypothetical protein
MNSIASLLFTMAALGQIGNGGVGMGGTPPGVKAGWKIESDGSMSYIGQVTAEIAMQMSTQGKEMAIDIPDYLQGRISRVVWRIGSEEVEQEPSEAELRAMPARQMLPPNSGNGLGGLTSLSDRSSAITVPIDSPRSNSMTTMTMPTLGTTRATDSDPTLPPVPSLAQSYPSSTARAAQANSPDLYRTGVNTGSSGPSLGLGSALPNRDTLPPGTSRPVFGPQLPPAGYTGRPITVTGTSTSNGTSTNWNDSQLGTNSGQYNNNSLSNNNPLANGTFGTPNTYGGVNTGNAYAAPQSSVYPNGSNGYTGTVGSQPGASGYPVNGQFTSTNAASQPGYSNTYGANTIGRPDALMASSNPNYPTSYPSNNQQPMYPTGQQGTPPSPWNPPYAAPTNNYGTTANTGVVQPTVPLMASNLPPSVVNRTMVDGTKRTTSSTDDIDYSHVSPTPPSYVVVLLLASLVGNFYLVMLLNQLLQRYRSLQASSRGSTSLAI